MADKRLLTDRYLRALPPAPKGQRIEVFDARLPGFGIRVSDTKDAHPARRGKAGRITFVLTQGFRGAAPTRRTIGIYGADGMRLEQARRTAGEWRSQVARGIDPAVVEAERRAAEARARALRVKHSFTIAAEAFIAAKLEKERSGKVAERDLRNVFIAAWAERPVSEITKLDVLEIINTKKLHAPQMARALLVLIKRFFGWVVDQEIYGLSTSPCEGLLAKKLIGEMQSRDRRLTDAEIFAFWRATGRMGYPAGAVYRMLLLTGLRLNEAAQISWPEIQGSTIVIPASRMKGREGKAREHLVPLSSEAREVIASLPRIKNGPFLFSYERGQAAADDDRPDQGRSGPAHGADAQGAGPPSRRGPSRRHAGRLGQPRSAPRHSLRPVGIARRSQRRGSGACPSAARHRPHLQSARIRGREGRGAGEVGAAARDIVNPVPAAPAKVVKLPRRRR